jgi:dihydroorotate dehydrogenase
MARLMIRDSLFQLGKPFLHALDAETAHGLTLKALRLMPPPSPLTVDPMLRQNLFGLDFPNPLGLAPGFDKNAEVPDQMLALGFGFVEIGTVTPRPQIGNPRPRLFRLVEDEAVINRMGFNNEGHGPAFVRLRDRKSSGIVGVNIGANKDSADRMADYVAGIAVFAELASYITINISSPNTPGLRGLQSADELAALLSRLNAARSGLSAKIPMLLKIAPDLSDAEMRDIAQCCGNGAVDGVIISNTTLGRPALRSRHARESGGLSGKPLQQLATQKLAQFHQYTDGKVPLVGVGGIDSAKAALERILAGARLLQVYSALVYKGPQLVRDIITGLPALLRARGFQSVADACGADAARLAATRQGLADRP